LRLSAEEETMASHEAEALKTLYRGWAAALAANP
jgi:hypothetical protein